MSPWYPSAAHRFAVHLTVLTALSAAGLASADAREGRRRKSRRAVAKSPTSAGLRHVGHPKVVVARREHVRSYAEAAEAFKRIASAEFPVSNAKLDIKEKPAELLEEIQVERPRVVLAMGPFAGKIMRHGLKPAVPVVFAFVSQRPDTTVPHGGWLVHGARSAVVLGWVRLIFPRVKSVAVVVRDPQSELARAFRAACRQGGVKPLFAVARTAKEVPRSVAALMPKRPGAVWLGHWVSLYPSHVLRQLERLQLVFRVPVIGLAQRHAQRHGLFMAIDASPDEVAQAAYRLIRRWVGSWLRVQRSRRGGGRRRRERTRRGSRSRSRELRSVVKRDPSQLVSERVATGRVTLNLRSAGRLGVPAEAVKRARAAGAVVAKVSR